MSTQAFSLNTVIDDCKADKACNEAYPNVKNAYVELIKRLDTSPITISISDPHCDNDAGCPPVDIILNDNLFSGYFVNELFSPYPVPRLPKIIYEANQGNYTSLIEMINAQQEGGHITSSMGRYYSTVCHDNVYADSKEAIEKSLTMYPWLGVPYYQPIGIGGAIKAVCDAWVTQTAAPEDTLPVSSDVPAVILQGIYDPYSSPVWGRHVYSTLSNSYLYAFPGLTHVPILGEPCPISIAEQFIENPNQEPDSSCMATPETKAYADLNLETGELHIPYVRVPGGSDMPPAIYDAYLMLQPDSLDFRLDLDRVKLR
jgi:hypothetical protein